MSTKPQFVKVLLPGVTSQHLGIPPAFWKHISGLSSGNVSLLGPSGRIWPANLVIKEGHMYFENGWQEFVRDHSIKCGEVLLFKYDGNSCFRVLVFDASSCERKDCHSVKPCREAVRSKTFRGAKSARQTVTSSPAFQESSQVYQIPKRKQFE
ncbi:B3 domain-containing protein [Acorus calamus]|uniref:B3 domain-containing protein n=1 Tax=Acorus calamus TaxID=4465 RepID=A0AAV9D680_ACOCL|nr:B3 domain-containing protein [Acorus calamus]